jgi:hypothetical protein
MSVTVNTGAGPPYQLPLRRGRPRYAGGYLWDVLQYISFQQRKNHWRPVHIANSIACRDLRMSKSSWLRIVRVAEAMRLVKREARRGGWNNKGSVYWLSDPPNEIRPPSPNGHGGPKSGVPSFTPEAEAAIQNLIAGPALSYSKSRYPNSERTYPNGSRPNSLNVPGNGPMGPLSRIAEGTLRVPSSPSERKTAAAVAEEAGTAGQSSSTGASGSVNDAADGSPSHSPSHTSGQGQQGKGVPVRVSDGEDFVVPRSGPSPETMAYVLDVLGRPAPGSKARRYLEAVRRLEEQEGGR